MRKIYHRSLYTKNDAGNIFFMALFLPAIFAMLLLTIIVPIAFINQNAEMSENYAMIMSILSILSAQGGMFLVYFLYNKILRMNPFKAGRISFKLNIVNVLLAILFGAIALFGLNNFISVFDSLFQKMGHIPQDLPLPLDNGWWFALNLVLLAVVPAIVEELLFRGVIYNGLKQYGKKTAIVLSAVLFALIHGNVDQTIYPILFGLILAYIVYKTDNIIYSMIAHFVNNAIVLTFNFIYTMNPSMIENLTIDSFLTPTYILTAVAFMLIAMTSIFFLGKLFKKAPNQTTISLLEEIPDTVVVETLEVLNSDTPNPESPSGVDRQVWEKIICQKNDIFALEKAKNSSNVMLWVGIGISVIFWLLSL